MCSACECVYTCCHGEATSEYEINVVFCLTQLMLRFLRKLSYLQLLFFLPNFASISILTLDFLPCQRPSLPALEAKEPYGGPLTITREQGLHGFPDLSQGCWVTHFQTNSDPKTYKKSAQMELKVGKALDSPAWLRAGSQWGQHRCYLWSHICTSWHVCP